MLLDYYGLILLRRMKHNSKEVIQSFGELNPDKIIYIITLEAENVGLMSYVSLIMGHIDYAIKKGYYPVVDMQNHKNTYLSADKVGKENSWEYYFKQPVGIGVEEAYQSNNVIICQGVPVDWPNDKREIIVYKKLIRKRWKDIADKYIHIQKEVLDEVKKQQKMLFDEQDRVLGVKLRGTDYTALKPWGHSRQPKIEDTIKKTKDTLKKYKCNKIYLSTEDQSIYKQYKDEFGDMVVTSEQYFYEYDGIHYISDMRSDRKNDAYLQGLEYLVCLLILSECNCFIAGRNGGAVGALLFEKGFEYEYVWNLGYYL